MIYTSQVYDTVLALVRKDKRGLSFSPDDFNNAVVAVNQRIYRLNYQNFESSKLSMDEMDSFKIPNFTIYLDVNGIGSLPKNYFHLVGDPYYIHPTAGRRKIDLITTLEHGSREMDYLTKSTALYPTCFMGYGLATNDMCLYVSPSTCTPIYITYLRSVNTPYLDYYTNDATLEITYMGEGAFVTIPLGCTSRSGVGGGTEILSQTIDFEWHEHDEPQIVNLLLEAVGVSLPDEMLIKVSNVNEPRIEKA